MNALFRVLKKQNLSMHCNYKTVDDIEMVVMTHYNMGQEPETIIFYGLNENAILNVKNDSKLREVILQEYHAGKARTANRVSNAST